MQMRNKIELIVVVGLDTNENLTFSGLNSADQLAKVSVPSCFTSLSSPMLKVCISPILNVSGKGDSPKSTN